MTAVDRYQAAAVTLACTVDFAEHHGTLRTTDSPLVAQALQVFREATEALDPEAAEVPA